MSRHIHQLIKKSILRSLLGSSEVFPDQYNPPNHISKEGLKHWPAFWKKHGEFILESGKGDQSKTWAAAVAIFVNSCLKRNIKPFTKASQESNEPSEPSTEEVTDSKSRAYMRKRFMSNRQKSVKNSASIIRYLIKTKTVKKALEEKFHKVYYSDTKKQISFLTSTPVELVKPYSEIKTFISDFLAKKDFKKGKKHFILTDGITDIIITPDDKNEKRLNVFSVMHFTPAHVEFIVSRPDSEIDTIDKLLLAATEEFKNLIADINVGLIASYHHNPFSKPEWDIDFNTPLTEQEQKDIFEIIKHVDKTTVDKFTEQFYIEYIIAGEATPQYKYQLVRALIAAFKAHDLIIPLAWEKAAEDPDDWFNPFFYKKRLLREEDEELEEELKNEYSLNE